MNDHVSISGMVMDMWRTQGRADRCRTVDSMVAELGPCAPIPQFEDVAEDARHWAAMADDKTRAIVLDAIFQALSPERQQAAAKYMTEFLAKLEAGKAEPRSG